MFLLDNEKQHGWMDGIRQNLSQVRGGMGGWGRVRGKQFKKQLLNITALMTRLANTDIYKCSFFPQTIRDWNSLTDTFLSAAEGVHFSCKG